MGLRRLGRLIAMLATAVAVIWMATLVAIAFVSSDSGGGIGHFSACITQTRYLVLSRHGRVNGLVDTITDRAREAMVGEVTDGENPTHLGGAAAGNHGYVMSTATPVGRDASAIEGCWDRFFPLD